MDAVRQSLSKNPGILLQSRQAELRLGEFEAAGGPFDPTLRGAVFRGDDHLPLTSSDQAFSGGESEIVTRTTSYRLRLDRQLRTGTILSPGIEMTRIDQSLPAEDPENRSAVNFIIVQPLFRGRGASSAQVTGEQAAGKEYDATRHEPAFTVNRTVLLTTSAYWDYLAARKSLEILRDSEEVASRLVEEIKELIAADERPRSDLGQVEANLADKVAARIDAEQTVFQARQLLGLSMGVSTDEIAALGPAATPFPSLAEAASLDPAGTNGFLDLATARRPDLQAAKLREQAGEQLVAGAKNRMLPQVDLQVELGYAGLDEGHGFRRLHTAFFEDAKGLNASARLSLALPLRNQEARGVFRQRKALLEQQEILTADLSRQIASNVSVSLSALRTGAEELKKTERAVQYYRDSIEDEKTKLKLGMSTILDLISLQDRLTNALLGDTLQHSRYAKALATLRFETGTLIEPGEETYSVSMEALTGVPEAGGERTVDGGQ